MGSLYQYFGDRNRSFVSGRTASAHQSKHYRPAQNPANFRALRHHQNPRPTPPKIEACPERIPENIFFAPKDLEDGVQDGFRD
jgi:hypothetical protein